MEINDTVLAEALLKIKIAEIACIPDTDKINHCFSESFENRMNALIKSLNYKEGKYSKFTNPLTKAAVIFITVLISILSVIMLNPKVRAEFTNAIIEFYENHIKFSFISTETQQKDFVNYENIYPAYVPQGFKLKEKFYEYEAVGFRYENTEEDLNYDIFISLNDGLSVHTDLPEKDIEKTIIEGKNAYLILDSSDNQPYSTLIISGSRITVTIYGQLDRNEIINIGKAIREKHNNEKTERNEK